MVLAYMLSMFSSLITGIAGFTLFNLQSANQIMGFFSDYKIGLFKLLINTLLIFIYHQFIRMFRDRIAAQKGVQDHCVL